MRSRSQKALDVASGNCLGFPRWQIVCVKTNCLSEISTLTGTNMADNQPGSKRIACDIGP
jgi:hypothetical protein